MSGSAKRLIFIATLSVLIPELTATDDCTIATSSVSATCGVATALAGIGTAILCGATMGAGCAAFTGVAALGASCAAIADNVPCGDSDTEKIINTLNKIEDDIETLTDLVDVGFYKQKYQEDMEIIENVGELYEKWVTPDSNGNYMDTDSSRAWVAMMGAGKDVELANALIEIEDMIGGEEGGFSPDPSIYHLAREKDLCSQNLFEYISNLLVQGTNLRMIAFDNRGRSPPSGILEDLKERLILNVQMYERYCVLNLPIEAFRVKISDRSYAGSSGKLRIGVRQGERSCETTQATFPGCQRNREYTKDRTEDERLFGGCIDKWFQPTLNPDKLEIRVLSDSGDDNYIDEAGIKIGGKWRNFHVHHVKVNKHGAGNSWRTVINKGAEGAEACEHDSPLVINCGEKLISIKHAAYGVYSNDNTCGRSYSGRECISDTSLKEVQERCHGKNSCSVAASNSVFGDPCGGTRKYLTVTWQCDFGAERGEACEHSGSPLVINCGEKVIDIKHAAWGVYSNDNTCGRSYDGNCVAGTSLQVVRDRCQGRNSCSVEASNGLFGDPCGGTPKYLTAAWDCN